MNNNFGVWGTLPFPLSINKKLHSFLGLPIFPDRSLSLLLSQRLLLSHLSALLLGLQLAYFSGVVRSFRQRSVYCSDLKSSTFLEDLDLLLQTQSEGFGIFRGSLAYFTNICSKHNP